jgi:cellulose synthase operon protein C
MTVRWKPLLVLSGVFAAIAVLGFCAIAYTLMPRRSADILPKARAERAARQYDKAQIHYRRALQMDGKNPAIHEEMATMFGEWADRAPVEKQAEIRGWRLASLAEAAKYGKNLKEPRRQLLAAAMAQDEVPESLHWAKELLALEAGNADAHFVIASETLETRAPVLADVRRHLAALEEAKAPEVRVAWIKARLAQVSDDAPAIESVLTRARALSLGADAGPVDRSALLRLRAIDVELTSDVGKLGDRVKALQVEARALVSGAQVAPNRIMRMSLLLERVQKSLTLTASRNEAALKGVVNTLVDSIEEDVEAIFKRTLAASSKTDLHVYLTYADHLRFRGKRDRCLEVVDQSLKSPLASLPTSGEVVMGLHAVAVESVLSETKDEARAEKAAPHIKELIAATSPRFQGLGHLFQGAIELEQSGVAGVPAKDGGASLTLSAKQLKLRASAVNHLRIAAEKLPDVVEAQARYGVALILSQDLSLGRQYLQNAMRLGNAEPQYQVWAAWSMLQAGYPEEAEPVVNHLLNELAQGRVSRELEGTLHLLSGEIHQAGRSPDDMKKALVEYDLSYAGKAPPASIQLRMAQIDVQLGQADRALQRIEGLRAHSQGGPAAEHLAVLILLEQKKESEAHDILAKARQTYPDSDDLLGLEVALLSRDKKPKEADRVLAQYLARDPENVGVVLMRAQVLSDLLDDGKEARRLLVSVADRSENSAPLVQLALLDLRQKDYDAVAVTIAKIRTRWKEAAAADLLDAQLALEQGNLSDAVVHFDAALKKDPGNKLVQFWKAQIDSRLGSSNEATAAFEALARDGSTKLLDSGMSLTDASRSALANLALQRGDVDGAIRRFESLRTGGSLSTLARGDRWQLVSAYATKGQWPAARKEIAALLNNAKNPPTNDERVRAANYYRLNHEVDAAVSQLDYVLQVDPTQPAAVVTRAFILSDQKKPAEAIALIRKAIALTGKEKPPGVFFLMLSALENVAPPESDSTQRAMTALDQGLAVEPKSLELIQAKYRLMLITSGPKAAVAFVESKAKGDSRGSIPRLLAEVYREQEDYENAELTLRRLVSESPKEAALAAGLVRVTALQAAQAGERNNRDRERALFETIGGLIKDFRVRFPNEIAFLQEDCELAFRRGDVARATAITNEIDRVAKNSPVGPLLRARLYAAQGRTRDVAVAYAEALSRNPAQTDVRLLLGQTSLKLGETDEALRQAKLVLENEQDRADAVLLEARALAEPSGTPAQTAERRARAITRLSAALKKQPKLTAAYHQLAEIRLMQNERDAAATVLREGIEAVPEDAIGLAQLIEILSSPVRPGGTPDAAKIQAAKDLATSIAGRDKKGNLTLAAAVGFHKAEQLDLALAWAEKAAATLDAPVLHLNYGDMLLSLADRSRGDEAKAYYRRAVEQYDLVLKAQANSVEAINNKAWILHTAFGESNKALVLAQGLLNRVDPSTLPGEFFDTLGAIQEATGNPRDAEVSYDKGLRKNPDHPVLNYHMGKLLVADPARAGKAKVYLEKALAGCAKMSPTMAAEVSSLMDKARGR